MDYYEVFDGSYALAIEDSKLVEINGTDLKGLQFILIQDNCIVPSRNIKGHILQDGNNVILQNTNNNQIIFSQKRFIRKINKLSITEGEGGYKWLFIQS